jgi:hypothetical protein
METLFLIGLYVEVLAASSTGEVTLYVSRNELTEGETLTCVLEIRNRTKAAKTVDLPPSFVRRHKRPRNASIPNINSGYYDSGDGRDNGHWLVHIHCWAPWPAQNQFLGKRGPYFDLRELVIPAESSATVKVVVPATAFEPGDCKIQAILFENWRFLASSRMLTVQCGEEGKR